ncbi:MAG: alpha-E domain-containing protein, partial [Planctomycetota bacterium]
LILADESNPRSLVSQLLRLKVDVEQLPRSGSALRPDEERIALALVTAVQLADIQKLSQPDEDGARSQLEDLLTYLEDEIPSLSDAISNHFLSHLQVSRHLAGK